jgi:hypothetical protein
VEVAKENIFKFFLCLIHFGRRLLFKLRFLGKHELFSWVSPVLAVVTIQILRSNLCSINELLEETLVVRVAIEVTLSDIKV